MSDDRQSRVREPRLLRSAALARRAVALFRAMSTDYLLREQFVTDPAQIWSEYVYGSGLPPQRASVINQLVYSIMSNPGLVRWLGEYVMRRAARPSHEQFMLDFGRGVVENEGRHVMYALTRAAIEKESVVPFEDSIVDLLFGSAVIIDDPVTNRPGTLRPTTTGATGTGLTQGTFGTAGTGLTQGTFGTAGTGLTQGTFGTAGTGLTQGTFGTAGTSLTHGTFGTAGTALTQGTFGQGTGLVTEISPGGTQMSTGTGGTQMSTGTPTPVPTPPSPTPPSPTPPSPTPPSPTPPNPNPPNPNPPNPNPPPPPLPLPFDPPIFPPIIFPPITSITQVFNPLNGLLNQPELRVTLESLMQYAGELRASGALDSVGGT